MQIIIAAGGTGGHIFPAISLADSLKGLSCNKKLEILFICSNRATEIELFKAHAREYKTEVLPAYSFRDMAGLFKAGIKSYIILRRFKPDAVVGFGGYVAGPILILAAFMNVPTIIHEQNFLPGKANRILSYFVDKVAVSFRDSQKFFGSHSVWTGNPIRTNRFINLAKDEARPLLGLDKNRFTLLVMGGSQGAHAINNAVATIISSFDKETISRIQLIHLCGRRDGEMMRSAYRECGVAHSVFSFSDKMDIIYSAADLAVSRAGATTLAEFAYFGLPSVLVPYPYAKYHQYANAKLFADSDAAVLIEQDGRLADNLRLEVVGVINDAKKRATMSEAAKRIAMAEAGRHLAEEVLNLQNG